jgi:predicted DNA-binding protein YlxM (UPF0122 family)
MIGIVVAVKCFSFTGGVNGMSGEQSLHKTNRINMLFDFYAPLLTGKQRLFLGYHFHDDFSLGEIAAEFNISRQAVYEHIRRAEQMLEQYEEKLQLLAKHEERRRCAGEIERLLEQNPPDRSRLKELVRRMWSID